MKAPVVAGIGEFLWDMLPAGKQIGGAPANFCYFADALGAKAFVVSSVGSDGLGRELLRKLNGLGVSQKYISTDKFHPTGTVEVQLDREGKPTYDIKRNVAWDFIRLTPEMFSLAKRTEAVYYGTLAQRSSVSRKTIRKFIEAVPDSALKVFDLNLRQSYYSRALIHDLLSVSNVLKLNDDELLVLAEMFSFRGGEAGVIGKFMKHYNLRVVALTKGPKGAVLYCPEGAYPVKGRKTAIADTVGAGDSFTAALVMGLINGVKMETVIKLANRMAVYVCGRHGATPVLSREMIKITDPLRHSSARDK